MKRLESAPKFFALILFSLALLAGCNNAATESPDDVMAKAKQALLTIDSAEVEVEASVLGSSSSDDLDFSGSMELAFDNTDEENKKMDLHIDVSALMQADERSLSGDVDLGIVVMGNEYFVKLNELSSNDPSWASILPFVNLYKGKWLQIEETFIPENIRELQNEDEAAVLKREQMEALFLEKELFKVKKDYGVESLNGEKVYHYGLEASEDGFQEYMTQVAVIDGLELTPAEVEEAIAVLDYIKNIELYVSTDDYTVQKAAFIFTGEALEDESNLDVEVTIFGKNYNKSIDISAPEGAEPFNPLNLLLGAGGGALPPIDPAALSGTVELEAVNEGVVVDPNETSAE